MPLTVVQLNGAKPRDKAYKLSDGGGLHVLIQPSGSKLWRLSYRRNGRQRLVSFGPYPDMSLAEAREHRERTKRVVRDGGDPAQIRRSQKLAAAAGEKNTFSVVAAAFLVRCKADGLAAVTIGKKKWLLEKVLSKPFISTPIQEIKPPNIAAELLRIDASGRHETAKRSRILIGEVFRYGNLTFVVDGDPTTMLRGVLPNHRAKHHSAITKREDVGSLLNAIDGFEGWPAAKAALQIAALCFLRPGEIRYTRWEEIDLASAILRIPADRMKTKLPHDIPLSRQAVWVFQGLKDTYGRCEYVFPSIRTKNIPISENTMNATLRRLGYSKEEHCAHGFRTTASTLLNEARFRHDVIEAQLAHQEPNAVRASYNRAKYWDERVEMMQSWAKMLDDFRIKALI